MQALLSAFFHHVSRASRLWSTGLDGRIDEMEVVPPKRRRRACHSRNRRHSSFRRTAYRDECGNRCRPAGRYIPTSMILDADLNGCPQRTSLITSPSMRTSAILVWSAVTTFPLRINVFIRSSRRCAAPSFVRGGRYRLSPWSFPTLYRADQPAEIAAQRIPLRRCAECVSAAWRSARTGRDRVGDRSNCNRAAAGRFHLRGDGVAIEVDALVRAVVPGGVRRAGSRCMAS